MKKFVEITRVVAKEKTKFIINTDHIVKIVTGRKGEAIIHFGRGNESQELFTTEESYEDLKKMINGK